MQLADLYIWGVIALTTGSIIALSSAFVLKNNRGGENTIGKNNIHKISAMFLQFTIIVFVASPPASLVFLCIKLLAY